MSEITFEGWAIVELMGHRQRGGFVKDVEMFGGKLLRVDIPVAADTTVTEFYGCPAIYALRPCTEEIVKDHVKRCREYVAQRTSASSARKELEDLRAAINHHRREGLCSEIVGVTLPAGSIARDRWLTRAEAAKLILTAWRHRERQRGTRTIRYTRRQASSAASIGTAMCRHTCRGRSRL